MLALVVALKVATIPFPLAVWGAERIVVGTVSSVDTVAGVRVATVEVEQTLKGVSNPKAEFIACKTWTCDISDAKVGERGLYLLNPLKRSGKFARYPDLSGLHKVDHTPHVLDGHGRGRYVIENAGIAAKEWDFGFSMTPTMKKAMGMPKNKVVMEKDLLGYIRVVLDTPPRPLTSFSLLELPLKG